MRLCLTLRGMPLSFYLIFYRSIDNATAKNNFFIIIVLCTQPPKCCKKNKAWGYYLLPLVRVWTPFLQVISNSPRLGLCIKPIMANTYSQRERFAHYPWRMKLSRFHKQDNIVNALVIYVLPLQNIFVSYEISAKLTIMKY